MAKHLKPNNTRPKKGAIFLTILAVLLVAASAATFLFWTGLNRSTEQVFTQQTTVVPSIPPAPEATPRRYDDIEADWIAADGTAYNYRSDVINMLFIGVDYFSDEDHWKEYMTFNGGNSDVLILASLDTTTKTLSILEIPRDTMADLVVLDEEGNFSYTEYTNISAAHSFSPDQDVACELTVSAVSRLLCGIPIHRYVALDYYAIRPVNQLLGGIKLTFDKDYTALDPAFTQGSTVTLTDDQFYTFVHDRDTSDLDSAMDRSSRHVFLLKSLYSTVKESFQKDIMFPVKMYNGIKEYITTNLDVDEITYLARQIFEADFHTSHIERIPGELTLGDIYAEYYADSSWIETYVAENMSVPAQ